MTNPPRVVVEDGYGGEMGSGWFIGAVQSDGIVLSVDDGERDSDGHVKGCVGLCCEATRCAWVRAIVGTPTHKTRWTWEWTRGDL